MSIYSRSGGPPGGPTPDADLSVLENVDGNTFVYDPSEQRLLQGLTILFHVSESRFSRFRPDLVATLLKTVTVEERRRQAIAAYRGYQLRVADEASQEAESKNAQYLRARGFSTLEWRRTTDRTSHRVTHCWSCKSSLDNRVHSEHVTCGWIICFRCGACGCGYKYE